MHKYFCFFVLSLSLTSCFWNQSPKEKLQGRVRTYLSGTLNDPRNYFPIKFEINERLARKTFANDIRKEQLSGFTMACCVERKLESPAPPPADDSLVVCCWKVKHRFIYKDNTGLLKDSMLTFYIDSSFNIEKVE